MRAGELAALRQRIENQAATIRRLNERVALADSLVLALAESAQRNDPSTYKILPEGTRP